MTDLPTREQFAELYLVDCDYDNEAPAAYSAALTRIEELEGKLAIAVNAAGVQEARATAAEQEVVRLRTVIRRAVEPVPDHPTPEGPNRAAPHIQPCPGCEWWDGNRAVWTALRAIAAEGDS